MKASPEYQSKVCVCMHVCQRLRERRRSSGEWLRSACAHRSLLKRLEFGWWGSPTRRQLQLVIKAAFRKRLSKHSLLFRYFKHIIVLNCRSCQAVRRVVGRAALRLGGHGLPSLLAVSWKLTCENDWNADVVALLAHQTWKLTQLTSHFKSTGSVVMPLLIDPILTRGKGKTRRTLKKEAHIKNVFCLSKVMPEEKRVG